MSKAKWLSVALGSTAMAAVLAATPAQADRLQSLQNQIDALQDQVMELKANQKAAPEGDCIKWKFDPAPQFGTCDGKFEANLRGRLMIDAGFAEDDNGNLDVEATEARRARLGIEGKAWKVFKYKFETDFADNGVDVTDAYVQYKGKQLGGVSVLLGQAKTPNSLEEQTSSRFVTFSERAAFTDAFSFGRQIGVILGYKNEFNNVGWKIDAGAFRGSFDNDSSDQPQEGRTLAARLATWTEMNDNIFHLGGSVRSRRLGEVDDAADIDYEQRPFIHTSDDEIVETPNLLDEGDEDLLFGVEGAWQWDGLHVAGEWAQLNIEADPTNDPEFAVATDLTYQGWYVDVGYFIGGKRGYKEGKFGRPKVDNPVGLGGWGALQLAYRFDNLDLTDGSDIDGQGGELTQHIIAVNWWLNRHTLLSFNYARGDVDDNFSGDSEIGADAGGNNKFDAFNVRAQIDW